MRRLRSEMGSLEARVHDEQNQAIRFEQRKTQAELEVKDSEKERQEHEIAELRGALEDERTKNVSLSANIERLRKLTENLDKTKEELMARLQGVTKEKKLTENERASLHGDISNLEKELGSKGSEANELKNSIAALDHTVD